MIGIASVPLPEFKPPGSILIFCQCDMSARDPSGWNPTTWYCTGSIALAAAVWMSPRAPFNDCPCSIRLETTLLLTVRAFYARTPSMIPKWCLWSYPFIRVLCPLPHCRTAHPSQAAVLVLKRSCAVLIASVKLKREWLGKKTWHQLSRYWTLKLWHINVQSSS